MDGGLPVISVFKFFVTLLTLGPYLHRLRVSSGVHKQLMESFPSGHKEKEKNKMKFGLPT